VVRRAGLEDDFVGSALDLFLRKDLTPSSFANSFSRLPDEGREEDVSQGDRRSV